MKNLNSLMGELPALQESAEGKLKGGFASINAASWETPVTNDVVCSGNTNCTGNAICSDNTGCHSNTKCYDNVVCNKLTNGTCTPAPTTTSANVVPKQNIGGNAIFSSLMF